MDNIDIQKLVRDLVTPICILVLAIFLRPYAESSFGSAQKFVDSFSLAILIIPALLAARFKYYSLFYLMVSTGLVLTVLHMIAYDQLPTFGEQTPGLQQWLLLFFAVNFLLLQMLHTSGLFTISSIFFIACLLIEGGVSYWWLTNNTLPNLNAYFAIPVSASFDPKAALTPITTLMLLIALLIQLGKFVFKNSSINASLLGALIVCGWSFFSLDIPYTLALGIFALSVMLSIAIIQDSHDMAFLDTLTKLPARRFMEQEIKQLGKRYVIAMLDIDYFKKLNDTYGHDVGDQVLKMVANKIRRVSGGGRPARYGGEEFAIIFPGKTLPDCIPHLESLRLHIERTPFVLRDKDRPKNLPEGFKKRSDKPQNKINVTVSIGAAERTRINRETDAVMKAADEALYKAKQQGRNAVCY